MGGTSCWQGVLGAPTTPTAKLTIPMGFKEPGRADLIVLGEGAGDHWAEGGGGGKVGGVLAAPNASFSRLERLGAPGRARGARRRKSVLPPVACDRCLCYRDGFIVQNDMMTAIQQANSSIARPTQKSACMRPPPSEAAAAHGPAGPLFVGLPAVSDTADAVM